MSDLDFLREFNSNSVKPTINPLSNLSGSYKDTDIDSVNISKKDNSVNSTKTESVITESYSNISTDNDIKDVLVKKAKNNKDKTESQTDSVNPPQKFSYMHGVVGEVPKGYKAGRVCYNCKNRESVADVCMVYNFPIAANYGCDDFELIEYSFETYTNKGVESNTETSIVAASNLEDLDQAVVMYEPILQVLSDQELAGIALNKVTERFSSRSDYADAYLRLKYRRAYESKHGNLEGAFLIKEDKN